MTKVLSLIPGVVFFIYYTFTLDEIKASSVMGVLAMSIALGSVIYFHFNAPNGKRISETAFGITGKYRKPIYGTIIPAKAVATIIGSIVSACFLGFIFYHYGH